MQRLVQQMQRLMQLRTQQVPQQMKGFVDEIKEAYVGLSARGRTVFADGFSSTAHRPARAADEAPGETTQDYQQPPAN